MTMYSIWKVFLIHNFILPYPDIVQCIILYNVLTFHSDIILWNIVSVLSNKQRQYSRIWWSHNWIQGVKSVSNSNMDICPLCTNYAPTCPWRHQTVALIGLLWFLQENKGGHSRGSLLIRVTSAPPQAQWSQYSTTVE